MFKAGFIFIICSLCSLSNAGVEKLLPDVWNGDKFDKFQCVSQNIPQWLDGYFLIQTPAAYGKQSDPYGQKLMHMFDGVGAVSSLQFENGQIKFSAKYYPSRSYKIWDFYNRNMTQSKVAWMPSSQSPYNETQYNVWKNILPLHGVDDVFLSHSNIDFWRIGRQVISVDELVSVGIEFDVDALANFRRPSSLTDDDRVFKGQSSIVPLLMSTNERRDKTDAIYGGFAAYEPTENRMHQIVFKIAPSGVRSIEGTFQTGTYDPAKCSPNGTYLGYKFSLASYMPSITTTERYVILPMTSMLINPCKLSPLVDAIPLEQRSPSWLPEGVKQNFRFVEYDTDVPLRFLIFDKINKQFTTDQPVKLDAPMSPWHQFNAYESDDGKIVMDMTVIDGTNGQIDDLLTLDKLTNEGVGKIFRLLRFTFDPRTNAVEYNNVLTGQDYVEMEFPNFNRKFAESKYKYSYMTGNFFKPGSRIAKLAMDARVVMSEFVPPNGKADGTVLREPWFVPRPGGTDEDDGIVMTLGSDVASGKSTLYVVDAKTMTLQGQAELPVGVPLGMHSRFFTKQELALPNVAIGADASVQQPISANSNNVQISAFEEAFYRQRAEQAKNLPTK